MRLTIDEFHRARRDCSGRRSPAAYSILSRIALPNPKHWSIADRCRKHTSSWSGGVAHKFVYILWTPRALGFSRMLWIWGTLRAVCRSGPSAARE